MTARDYQDKAMVTMMPTCDNFIYMVGLLHEEAGELQGKFNKAVRKGMIQYEGNKFRWKGSAEEYEDFCAECMKELGDVCWAVAGIAHVFNWDLRGVMKKSFR